MSRANRHIHGPGTGGYVAARVDNAILRIAHRVFLGGSDKASQRVASSPDESRVQKPVQQPRHCVARKTRHVDQRRRDEHRCHTAIRRDVSLDRPVDPELTSFDQANNMSADESLRRAINCFRCTQRRCDRRIIAAERSDQHTTCRLGSLLAIVLDRSQ